MLEASQSDVQTPSAWVAWPLLHGYGLCRDDVEDMGVTRGLLDAMVSRLRSAGLTVTRGDDDCWRVGGTEPKARPLPRMPSHVKRMNTTPRGRPRKTAAPIL